MNPPPPLFVESDARRTRREWQRAVTDRDGTFEALCPCGAVCWWRSRWTRSSVGASSAAEPECGCAEIGVVA